MTEQNKVPMPHLWIVLGRAYRSLVEFIEGGIAAQGICISDFIVLEILLHKGPLPMSTIAERTRLSTAMMTAAIDRVETRALVKLQEPSSDQRSDRVVELTKDGRKRISTIYKKHERDIEVVMGILSPDDRAHLYLGLKNIGLYAEQCQLARFTEKQGGLAAWQLRRAADCMEATLSRPVPLAELAGKVGLSESQFRRAFKASTGCPPYRWKQNLRIAKAQEFLRDGVLPLVQIALATGFVEQSHFSRVFQRVVGVSPGVWQRDHRP